MTEHLYGVHDWSPDWASLVKNAGKTGWTVMTFGVGDDPSDRSGHDFTQALHYGITPIARLNYSHHGQGTIPLSNRYEQFAERCYNFVRSSTGCSHWIIGNEPNLAAERPQGLMITPEMYSRCFGYVRSRIKNISSSHQLLHAAVAPYNIDTGSWMQYWWDMLDWLEFYGLPDGINLHTYSRGGDPASITSDDNMDAPYDMYHNGFRAYQDFLLEVPKSLSYLPVYITETDQNEPWLDRNNSWVRAAYSEINNWNQATNTQKVVCLALYRWDKHDKWEFQSKRGVVNDLDDTLKNTDFRIVKTETSSKNDVFLPAVPKGEKVPTATVNVPSGANLRSGPSTSYPIMGKVPVNSALWVVGTNASKDWWQVDTPTWGKQWVSGSIVALSGVRDVPVVAVNPPVPATINPVQAINREWMLTSWCRILNLDPIVARAILAIESGGRAFEGNRMIIRFENHVFATRLNAEQVGGGVYQRHFKHEGNRGQGHYWRLTESHPWERQHDGGQAEEWQVFNFARSIHERAAMYSISMGMGQIMGGNHRVVGYEAVQSMFNDYNNPQTGELNQLTGFFAYMLNVEGMLSAARRKDWHMIATKYNGSGNEAVYAPLLLNKYRELGGLD